MAEKDFKRKLTAILSADVEGYSRLMEEDEDATIRTLTSYRELMSTLVQKHRGRVVDSPGDNLLAEFGSVVDGVRCAVEIQEELRVRNAELPENRRMQFRIGLNLGDVVEEEGRIYGDGVNIAARVEGLAEGGGICISGTVYDSIKNKLSLSYESLGEHTVKNITEPVRVYRMRVGPEISVQKKAGPKRWRWAAIAAIAALIFGAVAIWNFYLRRPSVEPSSIERMAFPLIDKPSIAVLPFKNMSGDPEQEYFSDGITEELICKLVNVEGLKVISRTSAFHFKGKDTDLRTIGEKLKVGNILEGSVRKAGNKLRISAQLIKVADDTHLWAENYDRELKDIFSIQQDISQAIVKKLKVKLLGVEKQLASKIPTNNIDAYRLFLQARYLYNQYSKDNANKALQLYEKAIELDPGFSLAYASISSWYIWELPIRIVGGASRDEFYTKALKAAQQALEIDPNNAEAYACLGVIKAIYDWDWKGWEPFFRKALELNSGSADIRNQFSLILTAVGRHDEAISEAKKALELDPLSVQKYSIVGTAFNYARKHDLAIAQYKNALQMNPAHYGSILQLGVAYLAKGMNDEAISVLKQGLAYYPDRGGLLGNLANAYARAGQKEQALNILNKMVEKSKNAYLPATPIAKIYASLGDTDRAFEYLEKAYESREVSGFFYLKVMPEWDIIRSDPRFYALLKKMGLED